MRRLLRLALLLGILVTLAVASTAGAQVTTLTKTDGPISLVAQSPTGADRQNTDMAFWGDTLVQGDTRGIRVFDISDPESPQLLSDFACNGAYGDVSIWNNLVFRSVDIPQDSAGCGSSNTAQTVTQGGPGSGTPQLTDVAPGWEGIQIIDISNPSSPSFVTGVATDCGSHSNTIVPDPARNRVLLYVSSFPNVGLGPNCQRDDLGTQGGEHPSISVVAVPLNNPGTAQVINEISLPLVEKNEYFDFMPGYTGAFNNTPGYKGCKDITVNLQLNRAAAACVTTGVLLDISNKAAPTMISRFVNPSIDLCAQGVWRAGEAMNCMWSSAQFTHDGKRVIFGSLQSGNTTCSGTGAGATSCNQGNWLNVGVDPLYHGTAVTNECDLGGGSGGYRDLLNQGAYWMFDMKDSSWPISSYKIARFERMDNVGCTARQMNVVPVNGRYVLPAAWELGGVNVFDWTNHLNPTELAYYDVDTSPNANEVQQVVLTGFNGASDSFRVRIGGNDSAVLGSGGLAITNANVQNAVNAITGFDGTVTAAGAGNNGFSLTFGGPSSLLDVGAIEIVDLSCAPTCTAAVSETTKGACASCSEDRSIAWAAYWYNGYLYASYNRTAHGNFSSQARPQAGSRGLEVFKLDTPWANAAFDLRRLNPQTQERLLRCSASIANPGVIRAGQRKGLTVRVRAMGQPVQGARVNLKGPGVNQSKLTGANGNAGFTVTPNRATRLNANVPAQVNMLGCSASKNVATKAKR